MGVSIPSRGFWFFEEVAETVRALETLYREFQSPRGDFGFLKGRRGRHDRRDHNRSFQSPRGDFGFLKYMGHGFAWAYKILYVSIPSRGFWFFEGAIK